MATPNLIIGLGHKKRVGKDTFAALLDTELQTRGCRVYRISFAQVMKDMAHSLFYWAGLRDAYYYEVHSEEREAVLPELGLTPRQVWIQFGNAVRSINAGTWIEHLKRKIIECQNFTVSDVSKPQAFIITDVRYPNEADAIERLRGVLIKITRSSAPQSDDVADRALDGFEAWDEWVENNGLLSDLTNEASWLSDRLLSHAYHDYSPITFIGESHEKE